MEEPEIALPPHTQRRLVDFVTGTMGQAIVTSHSPYVIERFDPDRIVVLTRDDSGTLTSCPIVLGPDVRPKRYREQRRQFAEAVLANAVLVVEGATEVAAYLAAADVLDSDPPAGGYQHPDVAGLALFDAGSDARVPAYGPVFAALGKTVFGTHDTPGTPLTPDQLAKAQSFAIYRVIGYAGIEDLLVAETDPAVLRRFLAAAAARGDYPQQCGYLAPGADDAEVRRLARSVLIARKGPETLAPLLIAGCRRDQLPPTLAGLLLDIHAYPSPPASAPAGQGHAVTAAQAPGTEDAAAP
jgi:putative ATP-dependent endonuclease of OLD family